MALNVCVADLRQSPCIHDFLPHWATIADELVAATNRRGHQIITLGSDTET